MNDNEVRVLPYLKWSDFSDHQWKSYKWSLLLHGCPVGEILSDDAQMWSAHLGNKIVGLNQGFERAKRTVETAIVKRVAEGRDEGQRTN